MSKQNDCQGGLNLKKKACIIAISLLLILLTAACGSNSSASNGSEGNAAPGSNQPAGSPSGQAKMQAADLVGEVASIDSNKIELKLIEMPQFSPNVRQGNARGGNTGAKPKSSNDSGTDSTKQEGTASTDIKGSKPSSPNGGNQMPQMKFTYTGKSETVTIPDSVKITATTRGDKGMQQKTISLTDIKKGDLLEIWYSDKKTETISKISVRANQ